MSTPATPQSNVLQAYTPLQQPKIDAGDARYFLREFSKISTSISLLIQVVKELETRLAALGG